MSMIASGVASGWPRQARRISSQATRAAMRYAARIGSTDWLLRACRMPSCATRRSSSWVAGRASRAVARKRSRPAAHALTMASRWGGRPVDVSHRTRVTTARAMCLAMPACRRSSSSIRPCGSRGAALAVLDLAASLAISVDYTFRARVGHRVEEAGLAVPLHEVENPSPRVVACVLPLLESAVEKAVWRALVHVRLDRHPGRLQLAHELMRLFERRCGIRASDEDQQRCLHLRDVRFAARWPPIKADAAVEVGVERGLVPGVRATKTETDGEDRFHGSSVLRLEVRDRGTHVGGDGFRCRLVDVGHVLEAVVPMADARGPAEVVERHRIDSGLGEPLGQLHIEVMQPADVDRTGGVEGGCGEWM